jgi:hypothetical protein
MPGKRSPRFRKAVPHPTSRPVPLVDRLQRLLYEFHELGRTDETKDLILLLMKVAYDAEKPK